MEDRNQWDQILERITISGDANDDRYAHFPFSQILSHYRIAHTGVLKTAHPYELTRTHQSGSCLVVTLSGRGRVFINGEWITLSTNSACLLPPFAYNSIRSIADDEWTFAWVKYLEEPQDNPIASAFTPVYGTFPAAPLYHAIMGLHHQLSSLENKGAENLWVELIHKHVLLFAQPKVKDTRLWSLWTDVQQNLSHQWTVEELAEKANMSPEHLRRLCQKQFGRSAKKQLDYLRMRRARILLSNGAQKVEHVARELGYHDLAAFSNAFKKVMGFPPSQMR